MWINEPLEGDIFSPPDDIDHDTIQYFNDLSKNKASQLKMIRERFKVSIFKRTVAEIRQEFLFHVSTPSIPPSAKK